MLGLANIKAYSDGSGGLGPHSTNILINMTTGNYDISAHGGVLNAPVTLKAVGGNVTLD